MNNYKYKIIACACVALLQCSLASAMGLGKLGLGVSQQPQPQLQRPMQQSPAAMAAAAQIMQQRMLQSQQPQQQYYQQYQQPVYPQYQQQFYPQQQQPYYPQPQYPTPQYSTMAPVEASRYMPPMPAAPAPAATPAPAFTATPAPAFAQASRVGAGAPPPPPPPPPVMQPRAAAAEGEGREAELQMKRFTPEGLDAVKFLSKQMEQFNLPVNYEDFVSKWSASPESKARYLQDLSEADKKELQVLNLVKQRKQQEEEAKKTKAITFDLSPQPTLEEVEKKLAELKGGLGSISPEYAVQYGLVINILETIKTWIAAGDKGGVNRFEAVLLALYNPLSTLARAGIGEGIANRYSKAALKAIVKMINENAIAFMDTMLATLKPTFDKDKSNDLTVKYQIARSWAQQLIEAFVKAKGGFVDARKLNDDWLYYYNQNRATLHKVPVRRVARKLILGGGNPAQGANLMAQIAGGIRLKSAQEREEQVAEQEPMTMLQELQRKLQGAKRAENVVKQLVRPEQAERMLQESRMMPPQQRERAKQLLGQSIMQKSMARSTVHGTQEPVGVALAEINAAPSPVVAIEYALEIAENQDALAAVIDGNFDGEFVQAIAHDRERLLASAASGFLTYLLNAAQAYNGAQEEEKGEARFSLVSAAEQLKENYGSLVGLSDVLKGALGDQYTQAMPSLATIENALQAAELSEYIGAPK